MSQSAAGMPKTWRVRPTVIIEVNVQDWADTYGLDPLDVLQDAQKHLQDTVDAVVKDALYRMNAGAELII